MVREKSSFMIAQLSDLHFGDPRFDADLMKRVVEEINQSSPDIIVIPGDLTADGYIEQFEEAKRYIDDIECEKKVIIAGNHDCRNVGFVHFENIFGSRYFTAEYDFGVCCHHGMQEKLKVVAADSNRPDLNDGEIGRDKYTWITREFADENSFNLFILHHHLVSIPGTGRERNIVLDAGDVLAELKSAGVHMVIAGHKHVPYVWPVAGMLIITSGTASTWRTRGTTPPSYNMIEIRPDEIDVTFKTPGADKVRETFPRWLKVNLGQ